MLFVRRKTENCLDFDDGRFEYRLKSVKFSSTKHFWMLRPNLTLVKLYPSVSMIGIVFMIIFLVFAVIGCAILGVFGLPGINTIKSVKSCYGRIRPFSQKISAFTRSVLYYTVEPPTTWLQISSSLVIKSCLDIEASGDQSVRLSKHSVGIIWYSDLKNPDIKCVIIKSCLDIEASGYQSVRLSKHSVGIIRYPDFKNPEIESSGYQSVRIRRISLYDASIYVCLVIRVLLYLTLQKYISARFPDSGISSQTWFKDVQYWVSRYWIITTLSLDIWTKLSGYWVWLKIRTPNRWMNNILDSKSGYLETGVLL